MPARDRNGEDTRPDIRPDGARLTLRAVEIFVAVIEAGSLGEGARRLSASASSVSQQLTNLETALGTRLLDRADRPVQPTRAGRLFLARARAMLTEAEAARTELAELGHADLPALSVAVVEELDAEVTPALILALSARLPGCHIACRTGASHENRRALAERAVDLAVAADAEDLPEGIERHGLMREPFVLVTARGLIPAGTDPLAVLREAPMTGYTSGMIMQRQIMAQFQRLRFDARPRFEFDTNHAAMATVIRTRGWVVTTPLGYLRVPRLHDALDIAPLPLRGFARTVSLFARGRVLGTLPLTAAAILREDLRRTAITPALTAAPWLEGSMRLVEDNARAGSGGPDTHPADPQHGTG
ncbi:MAG: LysR family transcriptional regulator [Pseudomonadota bacterium]